MLLSPLHNGSSTLRQPAIALHSTHEISRILPEAASGNPLKAQNLRRIGGPCAARESSSTAASNSEEERVQPWAFGFQLNERYLEWDAAAHVQLLKIACAEKLELQVEDVEARLVELAALVPDLTRKMGKMKAEMLIRLLSDTEKLAERLSTLRELLPTANVSSLVSRLPSLVLDYEAEDLAARLDVLREAFGERTDVEFLVTREPSLLRCASDRQQIEALLDNVRRLLPVQDPISFVISNPGLVLDMDASDLPSAIDGDLTQGSS